MAMADFVVKFEELKTTMRTFFSATVDKFTVLRNRLNAHVAATGNVHDLEPVDIGLGNVPDWLPSTLKQAEDGMSNNSFVTPRRVDNYTDKNVYKVIGDAFAAAAADL
jgi:hypothetical protein